MKLLTVDGVLHFLLAMHEVFGLSNLHVVWIVLIIFRVMVLCLTLILA